ncbi:response regulator [bacterium]|nr:response regulator [bacterium]
MALILLVEDDCICAATTRRHLEGGGHAVEVASNCQQALEMAEEQAFGLIMVDFLLPDGDGLELTLWLRSRNHLTHIPIIMCTSSNDECTLQLSFEAGVTDFISKPVGRTELLVRVGNAVRLYEASLRALQEQRTSSMGSVVSLIAHEVNNPLSAAYHMAAELLRVHSECSQSTRYLGVLGKALDRIKTLVSDLRTTTLLQECPTESMPFTELVRLVCRLLTVKNCGSVWVRDLVRDEVDVLVHPGVAAQALTVLAAHLLDYAVRRGDGGGISLVSRVEGGRLHLEVRLSIASSCASCDAPTDCGDCAFSLSNVYNPNLLGPEPAEVTVAFRQLHLIQVEANLERSAFPLPKLVVDFPLAHQVSPTISREEVSIR